MAKRKFKSVWQGPDKDGVTYSLLCRFLSCRERFRLMVVEGLAPTPVFNGPLEFGNMWHVCEEAFSGWDEDGEYQVSGDGYDVWGPALTVYAQGLQRAYPFSQEQVQHWYGLCRVMFPEYVRYWADMRDSRVRTPLLSEHKFAVPYNLPSGRKVVLRGKWDSVDLLTDENETVWLQENKTKGKVDADKIQRQLGFDLQTMIYMTALEASRYKKPLVSLVPKGSAIAGVRYNVVKRPAHYCGKKETHEEFLARFGGIISAAPEDFFLRFEALVSQTDINRFRRECLDPILEQLCDWWDWVKDGKDPFRTEDRKGYVYSEDAPPVGVHWRHPFGVYNALDEGGASELDGYMDTGSTVGLDKVTNLFPELE